jgi:hypothetical protein
MMATRRSSQLLLAATLFCAEVLASAYAASLQHDIFERPPLETLKPSKSELVKPVKPPLPEWKPELRATITGGGAAMVNVDGRIVQIGQDIEGYRLIEVGDRTATFVRDNVRHTLHLNEIKPASAAASKSVVKTLDILRERNPAAVDAPLQPDDPRVVERRGG